MPTTLESSETRSTESPGNLFDLDIYRTPSAISSLKSNPDASSPASEAGAKQEVHRISRLPVLLLFSLAFLVMSMLIEGTRSACFGDFPPFAAPPHLVCEAFSPSQSQFWHLVFNDASRPIPSRRVSKQVAFLRYSLSIPRRVDYALRGNGARILQDFTSPTHTLPLHKVQPLETLPISHPAIILEEQALVGDCWGFTGSSGQVGIRLSERVNVTALALIQPDPRRLLPIRLTEAPQSFTVWCLVDNDDLKYDPTSSRVGVPPAKLASKGRVPSYIPSGHVFLPLFRGFYDVHDPFSAPRFERDALFAQYQTISTQILVLEINSNWGGPATCLYHLAVYGHNAHTS